MTWANRVTILRIGLIPIFVALMYLPISQWWAALAFTIAASTDFLDGYLARSRNEITTFGKFMDPIADKLMVATAFIILVGQGKMHALFCVVFVAREFVVSGFRLVAAARSTVIAAGWLGKVKTVTQIIAVVLLMIGNWPFRHVGVPLDQIALWTALVFTLLSMFDYLYQNRHVISLTEDKP